ncbi:flagellar biosynthetic protein FliO [Undibacterium sp. Jales W-56]|uniref:flagellar biosynthetic protein FliO n=1 Tax=Undibacterium sp. Jales W-56 TaxID=2897325 RepID=UPI0021D0552E|nr:flagellar biosynthetic protein FliO [Undibacterium sp. Jales W-56]MCU6435395.1 flagellar biosynthetic protein FliO [Undibacterium sp. Jales W-56]
MRKSVGKQKIAALNIALLMTYSDLVVAADNTAISPTTGLLQIFLGLVAVLVLMTFAAWFFKRIGPAVTGNKVPVTVIGGVNVGHRERIMVVEVADQWIVVGVTAQQITTLSTMPKQAQLEASGTSNATANPFASWLARTMEKRSADKAAE